MTRIRLAAACLTALLLGHCSEAQTPTRRALLIGINDYTASRLGNVPRNVPRHRDWDNLSGAVNDVHLLREMLAQLYGFEHRNIITLTDQAATRTAIVTALEQHLVQKASKNDVLFFYYAGHGSQVLNSLSSEPDKRDESIVPADSRLGAPDIRDKELRRAFNRMLDRGAQHTILMDNCHSGSGARGLPTGARPRRVKPDLRDVADRTNYGLKPEERGALVLAAAQDFEDAWEIRDDAMRMHGAFSWAWIRAMRDSAGAESAEETFARAAARIRVEKPYQMPVLSGTAQARLRPFLAARTDRRAGRTVVGVKDVRPNGRVLLHGGWANGLAVGSELRVVGKETRVVITAVHGLSNSEGRISAGPPLRAGALLEITGWAAPQGRPLRVWISHGDPVALAERLYARATRRGIRWITDPVETTPTYLLRRGREQWELLAPNGRMERIGSNPDDAIARIPSGASLFVQLPAPLSLVKRLALGPGTRREGIAPVARAEDADYILTGRYANRNISYAWVRPNVRRADLQTSGLPLRSVWVSDPASLAEAVLRLRRVHGWQTLESPPGSRFPYRLALRGDDGQFATGTIRGGKTYDLMLRAGDRASANATPRYVYAFVIDSDGNSILLYPGGAKGSVENRHPATPPAPQILLGAGSSLEIIPPYGIDTYFLLTTDEPLPNPWILQWDGARGSNPAQATSPLERLIALTGSPRRSVRVVTPSTWSLERIVFQAVAPTARK